MSIKNLLINISRLLVMILLFQYYLQDMLMIYSGVVLVFMVVYHKVFFSEFDNINKLVCSFLILFISSALINIKYYNEVAYNYYSLTGSFQENMYLKIITNGLSWFILIFFAYNLGRKLIGYELEYIDFMKFINTLFFLNGITNVVVWLIETGGLISRYNFISPITNSVSAGILFSLLGFFISLLIPFKIQILNKLFLVVYFINLMIVLSREVQVLFIIFVLYYFILKFHLSKFKNVKLKIILLFIVLFLVVFCISPTLFGFFTKYYLIVFNSSGDDMLTRIIAQGSAKEMFFDNPIFGVGYGMFGVHNLSSYKGVILSSPHSGLFSILSEWGILGIILVFILFIKIILITNKTLRLKKMNNNLLLNVIFLRGLILTFFISNFVLFPPPSEKSYYLYGFIMWFFLGVLNGRLRNPS